MLGEIIYTHRIQNGFTQEGLARGICSISYLSKIENNKIQASQEVVTLLFSRLGISELDILTVDDDFDALLTNWKEVILSREVGRARVLKIEIDQKLKDKKFSAIFERFALLLDFGFQILVKNLSQAEVLYSKLEVISKFFTSEQLYLYHQFQGLLKYALNDMQSSLRHLLNALNMGGKDQQIRPELYYQLALVYTRLYQIPFSIHYAQIAIGHFDHSADYMRSIDCKILLGINLIRIHDLQKAESILLSALKFAKLNNCLHTTGIVLHNLGYLYSIKKDHETAIEYYLHCLKVRNQKDFPRFVNTVYFLSKELHFCSRKTEAMKWIRKGLKIAGEHDLEDYRIKLTYLLHQLKETEDETLIRFLENEAIPFFQQKGGEYYFISTYSERLADLYSQRYQYKKSSHYYAISNESRKKLNGVTIDL
ncbi:helix-turn-helix domain-containing protein [Brevibacillus sp. NRS-1366]|uniref:helix-turn-helix domain-containing protein n=1 Tax=Brevibacillus sp. NRS-1366 TaxID=3233899 RepID=UPI003D209D91